jgi:hypothetical protein
MIGQLLPNTNEMLQCILAIQILDLNTALVRVHVLIWVMKGSAITTVQCSNWREYLVP